MLTPSANPYLQLMYLQPCKCVVLPFSIKPFCLHAGTNLRSVWVFFPTHIAVGCILRIFSWIIRSLPPHSVYLSLSISHMHKHVRYTHRNTQSPPSQLTLPQRHLSLGRARWWMQVVSLCMCTFLCTSQCENEQHQGRGGSSSMRFTECVCFSVCPIPF